MFYTFILPIILPLLTGLRSCRRQSFGKGSQPLSLLLRNLYLQGPRQAALQTDFPTRALIVQIRAATGQLTGRVNHDALRAAYDADQ
jgi:hypothetical protein